MRRWLARAVERFAAMSLVGKVVLVGFLVVYASAMAVAYNYTNNNPNFCRSCHIMVEAWTRWQTSEHRNVDCHDCHKQTKLESLEQLAKYLAQRPETVSKHAEVPSGVCGKCHSSGDPKWIQVAETAGHKVHAEQNELECTVCHSESLHRFKPSTEICSRCHEDHVSGEKAVKVAEMGDVHCLDCHNYLREGSPLRPGRQTCFECHSAQKQTKVTWPEDGPMKWACNQCHKPHVKAEPVVKCDSCHADAIKVGLHTAGVHPSIGCQSCHRPHEWVVTGREGCQSCHGDRVEHNAGVACARCHSFKG